MLRLKTPAFLLPALCLCAVALNASAQSTSDLTSKKANLVALERMWNQAQVNRDAIAIGAMIGERFVNTEYDGAVSNRRKFLEDFADPQFRPSLMNIDNVEVEFYGDTAIVTGDYHTKGTYGSKHYEHFGRFTDTWVLAGGKWMCVASHSSLRK